LRHISKEIQEYFLSHFHNLLIYSKYFAQIFSLAFKHLKTKAFLGLLGCKTLRSWVRAVRCSPRFAAAALRAAASIPQPVSQLNYKPTISRFIAFH
jgi:hypothetical protein